MVKMKRKAFTIAELMVAMIIIGAIGIILMPMIMSDNEKQVLKVSLEKTYASLKQSAQAISLLTARGKITPGISAQSKFYIAITETQKQMKLNAAKTYLGQYIENYLKHLDDYHSDYDTTVVLKNGIIIKCPNVNPAPTTPRTTISSVTKHHVVVDVNGIKKPNVVGRDIYYFEVKDANNGEVEDIDYSTRYVGSTDGEEVF